MSVDLYTKAVLTVIAGALVYLCLVGQPTVAFAQREPTEVVMVGWKEGTRTNYLLNPVAKSSLPVWVVNK